MTCGPIHVYDRPGLRWGITNSYGQSLYNPPDDVSIPPDPGPGSPPWVYPRANAINLGWALMLCPLLPLVVPALVVSALLKERAK